MQSNCIFALDIGTRSVVGIIASRATESETLEIIDVEMLEHQERSMIGGQIHDIPKVAGTVSRIKRTFEEKHNTELKEVAVAAAGRSLLTSYGRAELSFPIPQHISVEMTHGLHLEAVQSAQRQMGQVSKADDYHCVGYSILHQYLDEHLIGNLVGQSGKQAAVEVIASFLPRVVIDSLSAVLEEADLEMAYLTLEPIAAMNMAVPESMRQLNLALVDIGAGTSDIAISNRGTVTGYAMVPMAGDQITETLSTKYLLDFPAAEELKRQLEKSVEHLTFRDIMGLEYRHQKVDLIAGLEEIINDLAGKIAEAIIKLNGHPPQAVLCIGGGSLTPNLTNKIAACLDLPENRVAVTGYEQAAELIKHSTNSCLPKQ
ncbi:MAG: cell division protein FtsA [Bacillota bacterium]